MDAYRNAVEFTQISSIGITPPKHARIVNGRGMQLRVETGNVWITQDGCPEDVCLRPGESYCIEYDGLTVVAVIHAPFALVSIEPAISTVPTRAARFWKFWERLYVPQSCPTTASL